MIDGAMSYVHETVVNAFADSVLEPFAETLRCLAFRA
jgi:hypothetical protein